MSRRLPSSVLLLAVAIPATSLTAQQTADTTFARLVREYTTDSRFLPASVATLPLSTTIPSPQRHFGTIAGAPGVMHHSAELYGYFRALAAATARVRVETVGKTEQGRDIVLVVIADSGLLARTDAYRATLARLADPRTVPAASLDSVLAVAKPVYYLNGGLHSTEMGSPEMLMELAYRLAASDEPAIRRIREGVITLINPVSEPDGRDRQVDWYLPLHEEPPHGRRRLPALQPLLGRLRLPRQQPGRAADGARADARDLQGVLRLAPAGDARPARVHPAALRLHRHRPLQRAQRSRGGQRVAPRSPTTTSRRSTRRGSPGSGPGRSSTAGGRGTRSGSRTITTPSAASTRRSATPAPTLTSAISPMTATPATRSRAASGTAPGRPRGRSGGRRGTT